MEITLQEVCFVALILMAIVGMLLFKTREQSTEGKCHAEYIRLCQQIHYCPTRPDLEVLEEDVDEFFDRYFRLVHSEILNNWLSDLYAKLHNRRAALRS